MALRNRTYYFTLDDLERPGIGTKNEFWGVVRPHVHEILIFCFSYFKLVIIVTAGLGPYAEAIVDHLFRDLPEPHAIFSRNDLDVDEKGNYIKPLERLIDTDPALGKVCIIEKFFSY